MSPAAEHLRSHNQVGTRPAIQAALEWLPNLELDYDSWMRVGMALKGALGEAGKDLFTDWSAQAAKDVPATTAKAWDELQTRSHRGWYDLSPRHGARLAA